MGIVDQHQKKDAGGSAFAPGAPARTAWHFHLVLDEPLTPEQADTLDGLDRFHEGGIGLVETPERHSFLCVVPAATLTDAIADTLARFEDFPGVLVRSVELDGIALDSNGMATPAVVPVPG